jgi:hypothetical protein
MYVAGTPVGDHRSLIEALFAEHPHHVKYVRTPPPSTCGMHALNLTEDPTYRRIALECNVYAGPDFFTWLLGNKPKLSDQPCGHSLALYFADTVWKHVGVVPARYGDHVQFSPLPVGNTGRIWFRQYARFRGVPDKYFVAKVSH